MPTKVVQIYCQHTPSIGDEWEIEVEFRPADNGISVWAHKERLCEEPQWEQIGEIPDLGWRSICTFLLNNKTIRLFGGFWISVEVSGLPTLLQEDLVTAAFVVDADAVPNYTLILRLLLGFTDAEVVEIAKQLPTLIVREDQLMTSDHESLDILAKKSNELGLIGQSLASIKQRIGLTPEVTLKEAADHIALTHPTDKCE